MRVTIVPACKSAGMDFRRTYRAAAVSFADLVTRLPDDRWDATGLGDWTLRDLVGHTVSSALRQVPDVLGSTAEDLAADSPEGYWAFARAAPPELYAAAVRASTTDARESGLALGDDAANIVRDLVGRATATLANVGDADVVATPIGGMRVRDWLPTRTFELVVHGMDVAAAAGVGHHLGPAVLAEAAALSARTAVAVGDGELILRALTGRAALPPGFSVV
jgi:uncharacterized protein (TIGR03083 family)